jgi:Flp pilus assembly protein TadD
VLIGGCSSPTTARTISQPESFVDKVSSSVKSGTSKMVAAVKPKSSKYAAPTAEAPGKPGPALFAAAAQMHERSGNFGEAEANYRKALEIDPNHLGALVGYARLEDRRGNFDAATKFYQRAMKKHPKDATVHNDLGLCYHRRGMLPEATRELRQAVELDGSNALYRNNLAAAYVEQGRNNDALRQLTVAHGESAAHYNLGYLLMQKKDTQAALAHFRKAAEQDPSLTAAHQWIARLSPPAGPYAAQVSGQSVAGYPQPVQPAYVAQRVPPSPTPPPQFAPRPNTAYPQR